MKWESFEIEATHYKLLYVKMHWKFKFDLGFWLNSQNVNQQNCIEKPLICPCLNMVPKKLIKIKIQKFKDSKIQKFKLVFQC